MMDHELTIGRLRNKPPCQKCGAVLQRAEGTENWQCMGCGKDELDCMCIMPLAVFEAREAAKNVDMVNTPPHYTTGKIEVLDFILDQRFGYLAGQIIKYVSRYRHKNGLEDLKKAEFYLKRLIAQDGKE